MRTDNVCMMEPMQAAMEFLLAMSDRALSEEAKGRIVKLWNEDVRRKRCEK